MVYALFAAASPLALTATIAVLESRRGRLNGVLFAAGFLAGGAFVVGLVLLLGSFAVPGGGRSAAAAVVELAFGLLLLAAALHVHRGAAPTRPPSADNRVLERLRALRPVTALLAGVLLGIGGPKRLTITLIAAGTIAATQADLEEITLAALYIALASVLVWAPVLVYVLAGDRAEPALEGAQRWLTDRRRQATFWSMLAFGTLLTVDASLELLV